ncbi:FAD-dependent oxidoreductase [Aestuariivirga sp.]|uniref:FAD-dependent oxidoreductase n=1 Tax=Aestuariivirga sp. TaxID=2650926 RepID=UPI0039E3E11C
MDNPDVLIVGAGPAGLAAAAELAKRGVRNVLVIDRDDAAGGLPRFCAHPGFGIGYAIPRSGPRFAALMVNAAQQAGVRLLCRTTMIALAEGPAVTLTGPETGFAVIRPRAVILAAGVREANRGNRVIPGDRPAAGILTTGLLQQMVARHVAFPPHIKSLIVAGSEHVSFSAIWTARKAGLKIAAMIEEGPRVKSFAAAGWGARATGIALHLNSRITRIVSTGNAVSGIEIEKAGTRSVLPCDGVVFTAGWIPETAALVGGPLALDPATRGIVTDANGRTNLIGVYAAGNMRSPLKPSGAAARQGRNVGEAVAKTLS